MKKAYKVAAGLVIPGVLSALTSFASGGYPTAPQITDKFDPGAITVFLQNYAEAPNTSGGTGSQTGAQIARINFLREEPGALSSQRFFTNDLNGNIYTLNKTTRSF